MEKYLSSEEYDRLLEASNNAWESGDWEHALELTKQLPLPKELQEVFSDVYGNDFIESSGFNLNWKNYNERSNI